MYQENSYETGFEDADRIYRVEENFLSMGQLAWTSGNIPHVLDEMPIVENHTRVGAFSDGMKFKVGGIGFKLNNVLAADSSFFKVFSFEALYGDLKTALNGPNKAVISETEALKLFGKKDVVGENLVHTDFGQYQITAVIKESELKSHLDFNLLVYQPISQYESPGWFGIGGYSYAKLNKGNNITDLDQALMAMTEAKVFPVIYKNGLARDNPMTFTEWANSANKVTFYAKPIKEIYLNSHLQFEVGPNGDRQTRVSMTIIGLFILVIAAINFMNLSTARASTRVKEIGVKKVLGSGRSAIVSQFLVEYLSFTLLAALLGAAFSEIFIRLINHNMGNVINITLLSQPQLLLWVGTGVIGLGLLAGQYPAYFLSRAKMIPLIKGKAIGQILNMKSANGLRNSLVVIQFVISSSLIAASIVVFQQLNHLKVMDLGFARDQVVVIENAYELKENKIAFKNELLSLAGVNAFSFTQRVPIDGSNSTLSTLLDKETTLTFAQFYSDEYLPEVLGLELIEGEWFDPEQAHYDSLVIVNQAAIEAMGMEDPLNKVFGNYYRIQGVVKDFKYGGLRDKVAPAVLFMAEKTPNRAVLNINSESIGLADLQNSWSKFTTEPMELYYLDQNFEQQVQKEKQGTDAVMLFTVLAIVIAGLGLFGLAAFHAEQRKHEFGIRRVLGANFRQIAGLFSIQFIKMVILAFALSIPLAIYGLQLWLNGFASRITIGADVFVLTACFSLLIALTTLAFQSIKVSLTNPVETLRNE